MYIKYILGFISMCAIICSCNNEITSVNTKTNYVKRQFYNYYNYNVETYIDCTDDPRYVKGTYSRINLKKAILYNSANDFRRLFIKYGKDKYMMTNKLYQCKKVGNDIEVCFLDFKHTREEKDKFIKKFKEIGKYKSEHTINRHWAYAIFSSKKYHIVTIDGRNIELLTFWDSQQLLLANGFEAEPGGYDTNISAKDEESKNLIQEIL
jgi:hypothetical protein